MNIKEIPLRRLVPGLIIGPATWLGPYIVASSLFLPAMLQQLDSAHKVQLVAMFSTLAMIVAAISNMVAGALSDKTKSRFGASYTMACWWCLCLHASHDWFSTSAKCLAIVGRLDVWTSCIELYRCTNGGLVGHGA